MNQKLNNSQEHPTINRQYKDRLFRMVFSRKEDLLSLYNAINGTSYSNPDDLEVATLENALYLSMKNDLAFLLDVVLNLYEHQSTFNPNMPTRALLYFAKLYIRVHSIRSPRGRCCTLPNCMRNISRRLRSTSTAVLRKNFRFPSISSFTTDQRTNRTARSFGFLIFLRSHQLT